MSKAGIRFAFVRFIKVDNVERLVGNLCTLWIRRKHLQANVARYERDSIPSKRVPHKFNHVAPTPTSFVSAVKGVSSLPIPLASSPALVLDDSCMVSRDLDNFVMGEDDESVKNEADINVVDNTVNNEEEESDSEAVSDTYFEDNGDAQEHDNEFDQTLNDKEEVEKSDINIQSDGRVIRDIQKDGGSILDTLDEMIKVGQTIGFTMDGCTKDMEKIIGSNGD
nr:hypothetical protein CTI12_AA607460 [Tanacetum cinerariifolium]